MNVEYKVLQHIAWVTMNRPDVLNALSKRMFQELRKSLEVASADKLVRFIIMTGRGSAFSAGLDINEVGEFKSRTEAGSFVYGLVKPFWEAFFACEKPIISMVHGAAYGAGAEIALASDIVIASTRSVFAFSGGRVGALCCISAAVGPFLMGGKRVVEMNLTGRPVSAEEAQRIGLVNHAVPEKELLSTTRNILSDISKVSPISNAGFKQILKEAIPKKALQTAYRELLKTITSPDFREGSKAFRLKKPPNYYRQ